MIGKKYKFIVTLLLLMAGLVGGWFPAQAAGDLYQVDVGDRLQIKVLDHQNLTTNVQVNPDGTITFPYIDVVRVAGKTLEQISTIITKALSPDYIQYPEVVVRLDEPKSRNFYVYGEVQHPGMYSLDSNMTVIKAIALAGGYKSFANSKGVKILRQIKGQVGYKHMVVDVDKIIKDPQKNPDVLIQDEDIIVVVEKTLL